MSLRIGKPGSRNLIGGILFLVTGLAFLLASLRLEMGAANRMGPGLIPSILAVLLILLAVTHLLRGAGTGLATALRPRPMLFVLAGFAAFGLLIEPAGVVIATTVLTVTSRFAIGRPALAELLGATAVILAIVTGVFVYGLSLPLTLLPQF